VTSRQLTTNVGLTGKNAERSADFLVHTKDSVVLIQTGGDLGYVGGNNMGIR
jgi:GT2 family glycosyltransferase